MELIYGTPEWRQLQLVELEILAEFDKICRKHNINYSIYGGTLLGAIRHNGFIPWDDDIDITMTRSEYNKFKSVYLSEINTDKFFLQDYTTDPYYRWGYAKLRRNNSEYVRLGQSHLKFHSGVFIDIIVADNVPDSKVMRVLHDFSRFCLRKISYSEVGKKQASSQFMRCWFGLLSLIPIHCYINVRNRIASHYNKKKTMLRYCMMLEKYNEATRYGLPSYFFDEYTELDFEGLRFKAFKNYSDYLSLVYGDYMALPPEDKRCGNAPAEKITLPNISLEEIHKQYR